MNPTHLTDAVGYLAAFLTTSSFVPQAGIERTPSGNPRGGLASPSRET